MISGRIINTPSTSKPSFPLNKPTYSKPTIFLDTSSVIVTEFFSPMKTKRSFSDSLTECFSSGSRHFYKVINLVLRDRN